MKNTTPYKSENGFSLVELLVSMLCASVLILAVGVLSSMANSSFNKLSSKQQIYNDISYGFKLLQFKVRNSNSIVPGNKLPPWIANQHFLIDNGNGVFGLYQTNAAVTDLVYDDGVHKETIFSVPQPGTVSLSFPVAMTNQAVTISLSGTKDNIPFDMETTIYRRNP